MATKLYQAIAENNIPLLQDCAYDITQSLCSDWLTKENVQEFEKKLELSKQRVYRVKVQLGSWDQDPNYYVGVIDGAATVYDALLTAEKEFSAVDDLFPRVGEKTRAIFAVLRRQAELDRWISHAELAQEVSTTASSLTNIMKRLLQTRTVEYKREGKYVKYRMTQQGELYWKRSTRLSGKEEKGIGLSEETIEQLSQKIAEKVEQRLDDRKEIIEAFQVERYLRAREEGNLCNKYSSKSHNTKFVQFTRADQDENNNFRAKAI